MGRNRTDSHHLRFKEPGSSRRISNPSNSISESLSDLQLPQELITEILVCLPVKSLLKFKCVSKLWLSLISSPQFIRSHFSKSSMEGDYVNHQLLFTIHDRALVMKQCSLYSALYEADPSTHVYDIEHPYPSQNPDDSPWIVGVVNGLVCLYIGDTELFLWNPVLGKLKQLPSLNVNLKAPTGFTYGFGYDESNDDYKVVSFVRVLRENVFEDEVKVYSLRADSWKRIEDLKGFLPTLYHGMYANGKIYWSARKPGDLTPIKTILSLDMVSEKYGELKQPDYEAGYYDWILGVLCGRPIVLCDYKGRKADLWVIDKYGVEDSWCKVVSIPYRNVYPESPYSNQRVVCILSNGEIVLENGFGFLVYHSKHNEFRYIELDVGSGSYFIVAPYVESLVSP